MKKIIRFLPLLLFLSLPVFSQEKKEETDKKMEWFKDAKLGIFVHYGIYAVNGIDESWSFYNGYITYADYMKQLNGFTASKCNAENWVKLFKAAGARYAVLTSKHHDGVALWKGDFDHYNVVDNSPAGRDLIKPFADALRKNDMKVGLYYSLIDWSHHDYPAFTRDSVRYQNDPDRWEKFVKFYFGQVNELSTRYNPDLFWFDGDWEHNADEWKAPALRKQILDHNPNAIINSRLAGYGDYGTPEQGVPVTVPENPYWELCMTMNDSWGYQPNDHNFKTPFQLIGTFVDCISKGGNLLLDVGPREDGTLPQEEIDILKAFARWTSKHQEAIYGTRKGIPEGHFFGPTALSKNGRTLFLYLDHLPNQPVRVKGLDSEIKSVRIVGTATNPIIKKENIAGTFSISIPKNAADPVMTVVAIDFSEPLKLKNPEEEISLTQSFINYLQQDNAWVKRHMPLVGNWQKGISTLHYAGPSMLSQDKTILYLLMDGKPNGPLAIKGLKNSINRVWVVGNATRLNSQILGKLYCSQVPGIVYIDIPESTLDPRGTVVAVLLDGPISLYTDEGQVIESN